MTEQTATIAGDLDYLATLMKARSDATMALDVQIEELQQKRDMVAAPLDVQIAVVNTNICQRVLALGETVRGDALMAVWTKPRESVDVRLFRGLLLAHPEYQPMLHIGTPSVSIRTVRRESDA